MDKPRIAWMLGFGYGRLVGLLGQQAIRQPCIAISGGYECREIRSDNEKLTGTESVVLGAAGRIVVTEADERWHREPFKQVVNAAGHEA